MGFGMAYWTIVIWIGITGLIVAHNILRSIEKKHNEVMDSLDSLKARINEVMDSLDSLKARIDDLEEI